MKDTDTTAEEKNVPKIELTTEQRAAFVKTVKIGYFREFYKQGLITAEQLAQLIAMQEKPADQPAA